MKRAIEKYAIPLDQEESFEILLESIGDSKIVLLGEACHGTSEFYKVRADITKKLIEEKGFTQIAVEGDWPSCQHVNQYIKNNKADNKNTRDVLTAFNTWPTWMWANEEIIELIDWLKSYNDEQNTNKKVGFYGIDIYSLWESLEELFYDLTSLKRSGPDLTLAKKVFACFQPFNRSTDQYVISTIQSKTNCSEDVDSLLAMVKANKNKYPKHFEQNLNLMTNALIIKNAESYYRATIKQDASPWNIRDTHMVEAINTINSLQSGLTTEQLA